MYTLHLAKCIAYLLLPFGLLFIFEQTISINHPPIEIHPSCGTSAAQSQLFTTDFQHQSIVNDLEKKYQDYINKSLNQNKTTTEYTLPLVVHIIHDNGTENISDTQVETAITHLNEAFANTGYYNPNTGIDTKIQFCLANQDPLGNPSSGINRIESPLTEMTLETDDLAVKNLNRWDPNLYINIWLVRAIESQSAGSGVAGYAYFPSSHGTDKDGIVNEAGFFGSSFANSTVHIHEMGHYLGLHHTFEGGCINNDCLLNGDKVCDTPPDQSTAPIGCNEVINSCTTDTNSGFATDQNDQFWNYMDYGDIDCFSAFTQGQADRMAFFIEEARSSLLYSVGCQEPCPTTVSIDFSASNTNVLVGSTVDFFNSSSGGTNWAWSIDQNAPFSTNFETNFTFTELGDYWVHLTVNPGDSLCELRDSIQIKVAFCGQNAHVSNTSGNDSPGCGEVGNMCATIQYALDNIVCDNDTVFIHSGDYSLPSNINPLTPVVKMPQGTNLTLLGIWDDGPVIINGNNQRRGIVYNYSGFDCADAYENDHIHEEVFLYFHNINIVNAFNTPLDCNDAMVGWGAAVYLHNNVLSSLSANFQNCQFLDNLIYFDGGNFPIIYPGGGAAIYISGNESPTFSTTFAYLNIDSCFFQNNQINHATRGGRGGAIYASRTGNINIENSFFCSNSVNTGNGGAIYYIDPFQTQDHYHQIIDTYFVGNHTGSGGISGGAIDGQLNDTLLLQNSSFYNNYNFDSVFHLKPFIKTIHQNTTFTDEFHVNLGDDFIMCIGDSIVVGELIPFAQYIWSTGDTTAQITITTPDKYSVTVTVGECNATGNIESFPCEECGDGIDNDGDGFIDCDDPDLFETCCCTPSLPVDLGPDLDICKNGIFLLDAGAQFEAYTWQDGFSQSQTYTAYAPGTYWVTVVDSCGVTHSDTLTITELPPQSIDLIADTIVCFGHPLSLALSGFESYQWYPKPVFDCDTCAMISMIPTVTQTLKVTTIDESGCFNFDSILVSVVPEDGIFEENWTICEGETIEVFGEPVSETGIFSKFITNGDCEFEHVIYVEKLDTTLIQKTIHLCPGDSILLFEKYESESGIYYETYTNINGCDSTEWREIIKVSSFVLLPPDITICLGEAIQIEVQTDIFDPIIDWTPTDYLSCTDCQKTIVQPLETTTYEVSIYNDSGCFGSDEMTINVLPKRNIYAPNIFSPNQDGINDVFYPQTGLGVEEIIEFKVFNRWGTLVFENESFLPNDPQEGWDGIFNGQKVAAGVFVWYAKVQFLDGAVEVAKGDVLVVR